MPNQEAPNFKIPNPSGDTSAEEKPRLDHATEADSATGLPVTGPDIVQKTGLPHASMQPPERETSLHNVLSNTLALSGIPPPPNPGREDGLDDNEDVDQGPSRSPQAGDGAGEVPPEVPQTAPGEAGEPDGGQELRRPGDTTDNLKEYDTGPEDEEWYLETNAPFVPDTEGITPFERLLEKIHASDLPTVIGVIETGSGAKLEYEVDTVPRDEDTEPRYYAEVLDPATGAIEGEGIILQANAYPDHQSVNFSTYPKQGDAYHPAMPRGTAYEFVTSMIRYFDRLEGLTIHHIDDTYGSDSEIRKEFMEVLARTGDPILAAQQTSSARRAAAVGFTEIGNVEVTEDEVSVRFSRPSDAPPGAQNI